MSISAGSAGARSRWRALALVLVAALPGGGCSINYYYTPGVYEIAEGRVSPMQTVGVVDVVSVQEADEDRSFVFWQQGAAVWHTDRAQVAEALAAQLETEIVRQGGRVGSEARHRMGLAVPHVGMVTGAWRSRGDLTVYVTLDGETPRTFDIENKSPGNIWRTMNGAIAIAVIEILNDPGIRDWLAAIAAEDAAPPPE
jgi:hypothetical protein